MATFNFPYHTQNTVYPESSVRVQFGRGYQFVAEPANPDQRLFRLQFRGMRYIEGSEAGNLDLTTDAQRNMGALEKFYQDHRLHTTFVYPHPLHGNINCRFNRPLETPRGIPGGTGAVEEFEIEFIEVL